MDFHFGDYTYNMEGEGEITLSALLEKLSVTEITVDDVAAVSFSDPNYIAIEQTGSDWLLRSLAPFNTEEALVLTLKNGKSVEIKVTDAVELPANGTWDNGTKGSGTWEVDENGVLTLSGSDEMKDYTRNNYWVKDTPWFEYIVKDSTHPDPPVTKIVITGGITRIGTNSFTRTYNLNEIDASNCSSLTTIGEAAFKQQSSGSASNNPTVTKTINFSGCVNLELIEKEAFRDCTGIEELDISETKLQASYITTFGNGKAGFGDSKGTLKILRANGCTTNFKELNLEGWNSLETVELSGCTNLTSLTVPSNVTTLDVSGCTGLTSLDVSGCTGLTTLDVSGCTALASLTVPSGVTTLDVSGCAGLTELKVPNTVNSLNITGCTGLTSLDISGCENLDALDLSSCTNLTTLKVSNRGDLTNLSWLTLPASVTTLDASGCTGLTALDLGNTSLTVIDVSNNSSLKALKLPATVTGLNVSGCTGLTALDLGNTSLTAIDVSSNTALTGLKLPANVTSLNVSSNPDLVIYYDGKAETLPDGLIPEGAKMICWADYTYTITLRATATLDDIFDALEITAISSSDVHSIDVSDTTNLEVSYADLTITDLKSFVEPQKLTFTLKNGMSGTISVDCTQLKESNILNDFIDPNSSYVYENETYPHWFNEPAIIKQSDDESGNLKMSLLFYEIPERTMGERQMNLSEPMVFTFPEKLRVVEVEDGSAKMSAFIGGIPETFDLEADLIRDEETGAQTLSITGDYGEYTETVLKDPYVVIGFIVTVHPEEVPGRYELGNDIVLTTVNPRNVRVSISSEDYDSTEGAISYTVIVEAEGDLDDGDHKYPVEINDLTVGTSPALQFLSGSYTYTHKDGFVRPEGADPSTVNGAVPTDGAAFHGFPVTVEHMYDGDRITLTYTAKPSHGSYNKDTQTVTIENTVTITNKDAEENPNPSNNTEDDTKTATTSFAYSPLTREFDRLEGSWAYWKVTVNPMGYTLNGGRAMTLADTFDDDYPDRDHKTDANQSIGYNSVEIKVNNQPDTAGTVTYDYSGNTGTFVIPDNTPVTITYHTRITAQPGEKKYFRGTAVLLDSEENTIAASTAGITNETPGYEEEGIVIYPSASNVAGSDSNYMVKLFVYAEGQMQTGVSGVQFILLDANQRSLEYEQGQPVTFTTGSDGYVNISLDGSRGITIEKNTAYYLEMILAPAGYQKDNQLYSFMITDDPGYNSGGIYTYYNGDTMKVRLYPVTPGLRVSFRFSGSYTLRDDQKNSVDAVLQHEVNNAWVELERHSVSEAKWGAITFNTELSQVDKYRVIEENEKPWDLPELIRVETTYYCLVNNKGSDPSDNPIPFSPHIGSENVSVDVVIDNRYEEPQLTLVKMNKKTGELLSGAVFSVYKIVNGSVADPVTTYTTDKNGELVIRGGDDFESETLYGVVETTQPAGYLLPQTGREEWHYFYFCNDAVLEPSIKANLPEGETAVNLTSSGDRITIDNQKENITIPVMVLWQGNTWPENTTVKVGLYQSFDGGVTRTPVTDDQSGQPLAVVLSKAAPYNESDFTDLPSRDDQDHNITYSIKEEEINGISPLEARYVQEYGVSDAGVYIVRNRRATSLTVTKEWYDPDGTQIKSETELAKQSTVTFDVYRTTDFVLPATGSDVITSANMSAHVSNAEKVREGLTIDHSRNWNEAKSDWEYTINDLELMNDDRTPYLYYVLETVPSFGDETYKIKNRELEQNVYNIEAVTIRNTIKTETAQLTVTKAALVNDPRVDSANREFKFTLELKRSDGQPIRQWTVYSDENDPTNNLVSDGNGKLSFQLKTETSITLTLPAGVIATVTEAAHSEYTVETSTDGGITRESSRTYSYDVTSGSATTLTYINTLRAVCMVQPENSSDPVVFESLSSALTYLSENPESFASTWTIYMLEDYDIPAADVLDVQARQNVILTTASTDNTQTFYFKTNRTENTGRAVITRGGAGGSILKNAGTLTLQNIILDGSKGNYIATTDGGLVYNTGDLYLNNETTLRNSATNGKGGAVYSTGTVNMAAGAEITGNSAASASAICLADGTLNISGGVIENNVSTEDGAVVAETAGVRIYPTGRSIIYGNTNADGKAANIYLNANSNLIITVKGSGLSDGAQIGVTAFPGHMEIGEQFATADFDLDDAAKPALRCFVNDTNGYLGKIGEGSQTSIVWDGLTMVINKVVNSVGANPNDSFNITLTSSVIRKSSYVISGSYDYSVVQGRTGVPGKIILRGVKADNSISISPLSAGTYIVEEASSNYKPTFAGVTADTTTENGVQFSMAENSNVTVTNTRRLANVELKKTLEDRLVGDTPVSFDFTVQLTDADGTKVVGFPLMTDGEGVPVAGFITDDDGKVIFTMSPTDAADFVQSFQAPVGATMTITETKKDDYSITVSAHTIPSEGEGEEASIENLNTDDGNVFSFRVTDAGAAVTFANVRKMAEIVLSKTLVGKVSKEESFTFTLTLTNGTTPVANYVVYRDETYPENNITTDENGVATIILKFGENETEAKSIPLTIPDGTKLVVTETEVKKPVGTAEHPIYTTQYSINGEAQKTGLTATINKVSETDSSIAFTNTRKTNTIVVKNTVKGYAGNVVPFTYTATVTDGGENDYDLNGFTNGVMTFELTNGQTQTLKVPYGATLTVAETFIVGYDTTVKRESAAAVRALSDTFQVSVNISPLLFTNSQLIGLQLVNQTSDALENVTVTVGDGKEIFLVNENKTGQTSLGIKTATLESIDSQKTAILEVQHETSTTAEQPYTIVGRTPKDGYYYTIYNEPSFHESADPAILRVYNAAGFTVKGKLRYSVNDSIVTFTEQPLVSFDSNGGAWTTEMEGYHDRDGDRKVYQKAVTTDETVARPTRDPIYPTAEGIALLGWTTDEAFAKAGHTPGEDISAKAYDFNTPVTAPVTLYAVWAKPARSTCTVTLKNSTGNPLNLSLTLINSSRVGNITLADSVVTDRSGNADITLKNGSFINLSIPAASKFVIQGIPSDVFGVSEEFSDSDSVPESYTIASVDRDGTVSFTSGVCKITDAAGNILYDNTGKPAVYGTLSNAFTAYNGTLYADADHTTPATQACVKMLVDEYTIQQSSALTFPNATMTLTTAGKTDADFPYVGERDRSIIYRSVGGVNNSCFTFANGTVTLTEIVLDGGSERGVKVNDAKNGALINVTAAGATLNIDSGTTLRNVEYTAYTSNDNGGAIYMTDGTLNVHAGLFSNLHAYQGGAICVTGGTLNITGTAGSTQFEDCRSERQDGGAIYYNRAADLLIDGGVDKNNPGIIFTRCVAAYTNGTGDGSDGGAIFATNPKTYTNAVTVKGCSFIECSARTNNNASTSGYGGGGICAYKVTGLTVEACTFESCDTLCGGGAVAAMVKYTETVDNETVTIKNCSFNQCNCKGQAGALGVYQSDNGKSNSTTKLSVIGSTFDNCSSGTNNGSGGAIQCYLPCMVFSGSSFTDCWAGKEGGAINNFFAGKYGDMWPKSSLTLNDCTFTRCRAEDRYQADQMQHYGGAINTKVKTVTVTDSTFTDCVSTLREGGALHLGGIGTGSTATITGSTFIKCMAKTGGGAVMASNETLTVSDSFFYGCQAFGMPESNYKYDNANKKNQNGGGAISHSENSRNNSDQATTTITNCVFSADPNGGEDALSCSTATNGGAIWTRANTNVTITGCTIDGCVAGTSGGGVYLDTLVAKATFTGGSITDCEAVSGSAVYVGDSATFSGDLEVSGNAVSGANSGAIQTVDAGKLYFEGNVKVEGNTSSAEADDHDVLMQIDGNTIINTTSVGLGSGAKIGVYVSDPNDAYANHGKYSQPFGTYHDSDAGSNFLDAFFNNRDGELYGYQGTDDLYIHWGFYVCKITDADGNTLKRTNGRDAVYQRLTMALDEFTSVKDENGETGKAKYIKMLVENYAIRQDTAISNFPAADITLTTETHTGENAVTGEYDGKHPYRGTAGSVCTIRRTNSENPLFNVNTSGATFQLKDITLDGRKSKTATEGDYKLITAGTGEIIVNSGTTLQYAKGDNGAAIDGVTVTINGSYDTEKKEPTVKITNCTATLSGGAISAQSLTITNTSSKAGEYGTVFTNCTSGTETEPGSGGAIYATGTAVTMAGASFTDCHSTGEGGALFHNYTGAEPAATTITNCAFSGSGAGGAGGAVSSKAATLTVSGSGFNTCTAATNGGAINHGSENDNRLKTEIINTTFDGCSTTGSNTIYGYGGSVYTQAKTVEITDSDFTNSTAYNHGGALYCDSSDGSSNAAISGSTFDNCSVTRDNGRGGAISSRGKKLTLEDSQNGKNTTISNCTAKGFSGAVHMDTDDNGNNKNLVLNITGSTSISRCYANMGGAIYLQPGVTMNLSGSASFTKNGFSTSGQQVTEGACIYLSEGSLLNISGKLTFSENHPKSDSYVTNGGVYSLARQDIYIGGYAEPDATATSLHIAGELTGDTIWVWMQHQNHQQPVTGKNQFATTETGVSAASLEKLRNAHDKDDTLCLNSDYLTGVRLPGTDATGTLVYWNRVYEVSFKKKDNKNYPVVGAEFILYTDAACTTEVARAKSADGENDKDAKGGVLEEGTVYFEAIPIGIYYMKEEPHKSYKPNTATYLVLVGTPTLVSDEYNYLWESGPLNVTDAKTTVSENTSSNNYGVYEIDADSSKALLDTNLALSAKAIVNERLDFPVSFMKLDGEGMPLAGASFTIYVAKNTVETTDGEGNPVVRPALNANGFPSLKLWENNGESEITATSADGTNRYRDMNNKPLKKGVVYYREIPIGTYYLRETQYPERNGSNRIAFYEESDRVFRMEVLGEKGIKLYEWDRSNKTAYTDSLMAMYDSSYYSVSNINAVCKLTNGETLLYERSLDGETLHPAVYASLEEGFNAAQEKEFYDADGNPVTVLDDLKLQALKDFTFSGSVTYSNADRPLTFTTASRTASSTDRYVFNTNRTSDTSRALIRRHYDETNVQDGALILLDNVASLTLQNIRLDGNNLNGRAIHVKNTTGSGKKYMTIGTNVLIQNFRVESSTDPELKGGAILMDVGTGLTVNGGYNRTAIFSNNTVNNHSGIADGGAISINSKADVNNTIRNARFEGNTATASGESFGGAVSVDSNTKLTIDKVGFFSNEAANGGAVSVAESGELTIETGELSQNTATANGGAVYLTGGATAVFNSGSFLENTAADNGGAVWVGGNGTLTMSGVTIGENTAAMGSAVYVEDADASNLTNVTVTNASITDNTATGTNGGAINVGGLNAILHFGGSPFIFDNFSNVENDEQQRNIVLSEDSNGIINTTESGLNGGLIGVYVTGSFGDVQFQAHGIPGAPFGSFGDSGRLNPGDSGRLNPQVFRNDRALALYGVEGADGLIHWNDVICKLTEVNGNPGNYDNLLYQDVIFTINGKETKYKSPAVYTSIQDGFNAAQGTLYTRSGSTYSEFDSAKTGELKLKMLRDVTLTDQLFVDKDAYGILYDGSRRVTFTTAETTINDDMVSAEDCFIFSTNRTDSLTETALIKRNFEALSMLYAMGPQLTLTDIILDGANENNASAALGGIALVSNKAELVIRQGTVLRNSRSTLSGGAVHVASGGTLTMTGGEIIGNSAAFGGAVYVAPNGTLTMTGGEIISNTASGNGGAVYVDYLDAYNRGTMTLTGGTINGNTALNGAGVYLTEGSRMYLSGNPYFGGTGVENGNLVARYANDSAAGNFVNWVYTEAKNGGKTYTNIRQDIFLADGGSTNSTDKPLGTLVLSGALTDPDNSANVMPEGSIWVWADGNDPERGDNYHYPSKHQFALFADNVRTELGNRVESTLHAFRNARDDEAAQNNTSDYLYGAVDVPDDKHPANIYWNGTSGSRKVILRKVSATDYTPLPYRSFTVCQGTGTAAYTVKHQDGTTETLTNLTSQSSGVFWIGELPYGTYTIREGNVAVFTLTVGDDTVPGSRDGVVITPVS